MGDYSKGGELVKRERIQFIREYFQVAWTRAGDQALLTAGQQSFTSDPRFQVSKKTDEDWILIIR